MGIGVFQPDGYFERDFSTLLESRARAAGITLVSEAITVSDGLEPEA